MKSIADKKRQQNIAEYIIYMYQMEDLLRAYDFVLEDIEQYVVSHYPIKPAEKVETLQWFESLAKDMHVQKVSKKGHLKEIQMIVDTLAALHWDLLKTDGNYFKLYQQAKPHILQFMMEDGASDIQHEVQLFLNAIYGRLLARLHGREIPAAVLEATEVFGNVLSYLNAGYMNQE
ncbi:DUF4924 family protein [Mongoliitalea daihaiensis]|uniref:DUF4924 family protein n=1 Tax=Mongoliitalea daihaiensis TaxID=2782006 RepID=UPI001F1816B4|nr:DUF4924 family protein [Mongoliitalea daihaiensis]UJP65037.1 DUF4924 family protein [Mongoliitalea daihaiensis]